MTTPKLLDAAPAIWLAPSTVLAAMAVQPESPASIGGAMLLIYFLGKEVLQVFAKMRQGTEMDRRQESPGDPNGQLTIRLGMLANRLEEHNRLMAEFHQDLQVIINLHERLSWDLKRTYQMQQELIEAQRRVEFAVGRMVPGNG